MYSLSHYSQITQWRSLIRQHHISILNFHVKNPPMFVRPEKNTSFVFQCATVEEVVSSNKKNRYYVTQPPLCEALRFPKPL